MSATPWETLAAAVERLARRFDGVPVVREATWVSDTAIRFDIDSADTLIHGSLVAGVTPGARVLTLTLRHYIWVLGVRVN